MGGFKTLNPPGHREAPGLVLAKARKSACLALSPWPSWSRSQRGPPSVSRLKQLLCPTCSHRVPLAGSLLVARTLNVGDTAQYKTDMISVSRVACSLVTPVCSLWAAVQVHGVRRLTWLRSACWEPAPHTCTRHVVIEQGLFPKVSVLLTSPI